MEPLSKKRLVQHILDCKIYVQDTYRVACSDRFFLPTSITLHLSSPHPSLLLHQLLVAQKARTSSGGLLKPTLRRLVGDRDSTVVCDTHGIGGVSVNELVLPHLGRASGGELGKGGRPKQPQENNVLNCCFVAVFHYITNILLFLELLNFSQIDTYLSKQILCMTDMFSPNWVRPSLSEYDNNTATNMVLASNGVIG